MEISQRQRSELHILEKMEWLAKKNLLAPPNLRGPINMNHGLSYHSIKIVSLQGKVKKISCARLNGWGFWKVEVLIHVSAITLDTYWWEESVFSELLDDKKAIVDFLVRQKVLEVEVAQKKKVLICWSQTCSPPPTNIYWALTMSQTLWMTLGRIKLTMSLLSMVVVNFCIVNGVPG